MTQPNIANVVDDTVSTLTSNWVDGNTGGETPLIGKSDELGKGRDLSIYDYVELSKTSTNAIDYSDLQMSAQDVDAAVFCELKSSDETKRDNIFDEFRRVLEAENEKHGFVMAEFDRVIFADITFLDDNTFGAYLVEVTLAFEARSRAVET